MAMAPGKVQAQMFAGLASRLHDIGLLDHVGDHLFGDAQSFAMRHDGNAHLAILTVAARVAGSGPLAAHFSHGLDEMIEEKLLDIVGRKQARSAAHTHGNVQLAPQVVTLLVAELKPALQFDRKLDYPADWLALSLTATR